MLALKSLKEFLYSLFTNYCNVAAASALSCPLFPGHPYCTEGTFTAILWCDFALMFTTETERIWRRRFSGATVTYFLMRHAAVVGQSLLFVESFTWGLSDKVSYIVALVSRHMLT